MKSFYFFFFCVSTIVCSSAFAQTLQYTSRDWRVFTTNNNGGVLCYMASMPVKKTGNYNNRGEPFLLVTHRSSRLDEVSVSSGYPYKENKDVTITIGKHNHQLFVQDERAWAKDSKTDMLLVERMKAGSKLTVKGNSKLNTYSIDTYSLNGFSAAYAKMKEICR